MKRAKVLEKKFEPMHKDFYEKGEAIVLITNGKEKPTAITIPVRKVVEYHKIGMKYLDRNLPIKFHDHDHLR